MKLKTKRKNLPIRQTGKRRVAPANAHPASALAATLVAALAILLFLPCVALAAGSGVLAVEYPYDGVEFSLYRVGGEAEGGGYRLEGDFAGYDVDIPGERWLDTAATLASFAARDGLVPCAVQSVSGGRAVFSGLEEGMYLVTGDTHTVAHDVYAPVPFLSWVPDGGTVTAQEKYDVREKVLISCKVEKIWAGDEGKKRPKSVVVQLLKDGHVFDSAELNKENGWTHTWDNLDGGASWQVTEKDVPENYAVSVSQEPTAQNTTTFTVTNTFHKPGTPVTPPGEEVARTGDVTNIAFYGWTAALSLSVIVLVLCVRRKERKGSPR